VLSFHGRRPANGESNQSIEERRKFRNIIMKAGSGTAAEKATESIT